MEKVIFIDIDGTLRNDKKKITRTTLKTLKKAKDKGYEIVLCTGRPCDYTLEINKDIKCRYIIYNNGGGIYDTLNNKNVYENIMNKKDTLRLYDIIKDLDLRIIISSNCKTYINKLKNNEILIEGKISDFIKNNNIVQITITSDDVYIIKNLKTEIEKIKSINIINQSKHLIDESFEKKGSTYYDIVDIKTSKGNAIKEFCKLYNVEKEDCIGIGDSDNDLTMFLECGYKVAMGNSIPTLKAKADYITDTNNDEGVAKFLENQIILKK